MDKTARIPYIDLVKGICIILVVMSHCEVLGFGDDKISCMLDQLRMPLYFFLGGLFFKPIEFVPFAIKKINRLIVPYLFFCTLYIIPTILFKQDSIQPNFNYWYNFYIGPANYPLWFLICLFNTYIIYYAINLITAKWHIMWQSVIIITVTACGWILSYHNSEIWESNELGRLFLYLRIPATLMILPIFYAAIMLKKFGFLHWHLNIWQNIVTILATIVIWYFFSNGNTFFVRNSIENAPIDFYIASLSSIILITTIARIIKKLPYVSYLGRYSIIVLVTHAFFITSLKDCQCLNNWHILIITLACMPITIWVLKKYLPKFTAQEDLILYKPRKYLHKSLNLDASKSEFRTDRPKKS